MSTKILTTTEAAAYLNERGGFPQKVTRELVHQWCKRGKFPGAKSIGGRIWQIPKEDLDTFTAPKVGRRRTRGRDGT